MNRNGSSGFGARAKRRSESQRIGRAGELVFEQWCLENGLVANHCSQDFGIDYFCQTVSREAHGLEELRGGAVGVQVRSVKGKSRQRIVLDKTDAETALRLECPYLLVGVSLEGKQVYWKFLDTSFAEELAEFIGSRTEQLTLRLNDLSGTNFPGDMQRCCNPGVQHRLRLRCTELCIQRDIRGAQLKVIHDAKSGFVHVTVPLVTSIFHAEPGHEATLAKAIFEQGPIPNADLPGIALHPSLFKAVDVFGASKLAVTGAIESSGYGYVERDGKRERLLFRRREAGNTLAYISECGLVITVSESMKLDDGTYGHKLGVRLSAEFGRTFDKFREFDAALRLLRRGAKIAFSEKMQGMDIGVWGPPLELLGDGYIQVVEAFEFAGLPLSLARLVDLKDEEFPPAVATLWALSRNMPASSLLPRVLVGAAAKDDLYENRLIPCEFELPIILNVKTQGIAAWVRGKGRTYLDEDGTPLGLVAQQIESTRIEKCSERLVTATKSPEMWVFDWPAVPLLVQGAVAFNAPDAVRPPSLRGKVWVAG
jgi:hypothetical protein